VGNYYVIKIQFHACSAAYGFRPSLMKFVRSAKFYQEFAAA
jgi:hypothetical protein